jgi:hypothetical protein
MAALGIVFSPEEVPSVALLVLRQPLDRELLAQLERMEPGTEWSVREAAEEPVASEHISVSPPMLLLQEDEARSILETLRSMPRDQVPQLIRVILAPQTSCLVVPVELEQLR